MSNQKLTNNDTRNSPLVNKISTQHLAQSPISPFRIINSNQQSPFTVEQTTNCRLNEPMSPFAKERKNFDKLPQKPNELKGNNLKILTRNQKSPLSDNQVPISPFNIASPNRNNHTGPKTSQSLTSKSNQIFSAQADMPIIPQVDSYNQSNRSSVVTTSAITSASPAFYDIKKELNMSNINSMVSNIRKGQESNIIDKILFDTEYSGLVDQKYEKELIRHNNKNNTLYKCFSRSSSGMFSFKGSDFAPNVNSIYYIDVGNEIGTSKLRLKNDRDNKKTQESSMYQNRSNTSLNSPNNEKESLSNQTMKSNLVSPKGYDSMQSPKHNDKLTTTFIYDNEYLSWRESLIEVLKNNTLETSNYINAYYRNINNEKQIDYMLRMPMELLTLLNTKIK